MEKSQGQQLVEDVAVWLGSWVAFPSEYYGLVAALWCVNTWVFKVFDAVPYLAITASTKRAGKTTLLELLGLLSKGAEMASVGTPASTYRLMEMYDGWCTLLFDEAEKMSGSTATLMNQLQNVGYRAGQTVPRVMPGGDVKKFPVYGPKAYALIGDPNDTLRDRCLLFVQRRGVAGRPYQRSVASGEAVGLVRRIEDYLKSGALAVCPTVIPEWLEGRDQEIWTPLISLGAAMGFDRVLMSTLRRASADMTAAKTVPLSHYSDRAQAEAEASGDTYAVKALRDLLAVFREGETAIFSGVAVERMRALETGGWTLYKGTGLTDVGLSGLVAGFVRPAQVRMLKGKGAKGAKQLRGYKRRDVVAAMEGI